MKLKNLFPIVLILLSIPNIKAAIVYSETSSGDLSNNSQSPTHIGSFSIGSNTIEGTINETGTSERPDVFTFSVPHGLFLTSLDFTLSSAVDISNEVHFLAFRDSTGNFTQTETFLFASLVSSSQIGENLLENERDGGFAAQNEGLLAPRGYDLPLPSGEYTLWFQETNESTIDYTFNFTVSQIPEPASSAFLLSFSSFCLLCRKRKK